MDTTTITVGLRVKRMLDRLKLARRESYNQVLARMLPRSSNPIDVESLKDTIEVLCGPETMASLARSLEDVRRRRLHNNDALRWQLECHLPTKTSALYSHCISALSDRYAPH
jgi:predicted CopG family antitoxin